MDQLSAIRSFVEVVDRGGFAAAARALGLSGPMVGNHVRFLEAELGGLLLNRTTRAQHLTELGHAYLARCRTILDEFDAAGAEAQDMLGAARGHLRVTAPHSIGSSVLPAIIADFVREHPAVTVGLHLDDGRLDLLAGGFDVALRVGELEDASLITRTLAPLELIVAAAPAYLADQGEPATPAELSSHDCLDFDGASSRGTWHFEGAAGPERVAVSGPLHANSGFALRAAAVAGLGIVLQPKMVLRDEIEAGGLVALLEKYRPISRPVQMLTLPDRHQTPKLRYFMDMLARQLGTSAGED